MKSLFLLFIPLFSFGQKDIGLIGCNVKSLKTTCLESSKIISEVKYRHIPSGYRPAIIEKIYGRFEDLQQVFTVSNFKQNKIDFTCNENVIYDHKINIFYAEKKDENRKFYYLRDIFNDDYMRLNYKGTEDIKEIKKINLNDPKKYLLLYNKDQEKNDTYEVTYNYYDSGIGLVYSFHQRGNEFDEFTYEYEKGGNFTVYKNDSIWRESSTVYEDDIAELTVKEHIIPESYQLDRKNRPFLKESRFQDNSKTCTCKEGYRTKIEIWTRNKCHEEYILE